MLYFKDDLSGAKPFGEYARLGLPYETYKLALTRNLLDAVFGAKLTPDVLTRLDTPAISGYLRGTALAPALTDQWWMCSGIAGYAGDAASHFYLPEEYTDPFGNKTTLAYDGKYDLFIQSSTDALGNTSGGWPGNRSPINRATTIACSRPSNWWMQTTTARRRISTSSAWSWPRR